MFRLRSFLLPVGALTLAFVAAEAMGGPEAALAPGQAHVAALGTARAVTYYTPEQGGAFRLVSTVLVISAAVGEDPQPLRLVTSLLPGQSASLLVPGPVGTPAQEIVYQRRGDRVEVIAPLQQDDALRGPATSSLACASCD